MGLRIFSFGSLAVHTVSLSRLLMNGLGTQEFTTGILVAAGAILPLAAGAAHLLLRNWDKPSPEAIRQLESFDANYS